MAYLLDANVFMSAKNLHYGMDFCPAFWDWLIRENRAGTLFSIEKVGDEIEAVADELSRWAATLGTGFFLSPNQATLHSFAVVTAWIQSQKYEAAAIIAFLQSADYYLVSQAHADGHIIVTHEVPSASTRKIKIPDVCIGMRMKCVSPYEMLRNERARFILAPQP